MISMDRNRQTRSQTNRQTDRHWWMDKTDCLNPLCTCACMQGISGGSGWLEEAMGWATQFQGASHAWWGCKHYQGWGTIIGEGANPAHSVKRTPWLIQCWNMFLLDTVLSGSGGSLWWRLGNGVSEKLDINFMAKFCKLFHPFLGLCITGVLCQVIISCSLSLWASQMNLEPWIYCKCAGHATLHTIFLAPDFPLLYSFSCSSLAMSFSILLACAWLQFFRPLRWLYLHPHLWLTHYL